MSRKNKISGSRKSWLNDFFGKVGEIHILSVLSSPLGTVTIWLYLVVSAPVFLTDRILGEDERGPRAEAQ